MNNKIAVRGLLMLAGVASACSVSAGVVYQVAPGVSHTSPWQITPEKAWAESHVSLQEMVADLKAKGCPVTTIAEIAGVERKTVYSWLEGTKPQADREDRVAAVYPMLQEAVGTDFGVLHRVWRSKTRDGVCLESIFSGADVELAAVRDQLAYLQSSIANLRAADERRKTKPGKGMGGENGYVAESAIADFNRV